MRLAKTLRALSGHLLPLCSRLRSCRSDPVPEVADDGAGDAAASAGFLACILTATTITTTEKLNAVEYYTVLYGSRQGQVGRDPLAATHRAENEKEQLRRRHEEKAEEEK